MDINLDAISDYFCTIISMSVCVCVCVQDLRMAKLVSLMRIAHSCYQHWPICTAVVFDQTTSRCYAFAADMMDPVGPIFTALLTVLTVHP